MCRRKIKATSVERTHRTQGLDNARHNTISNNNMRGGGEAGNKLPKYEARNLNAAASLTLKWQAVYCAHRGVAHLPRLYTYNELWDNKSSSSNVLRHCELHAPLNERVLSRADFACLCSFSFSSFPTSSAPCFSASHPRALNQSKGNRLES